MIKKLVTKTQFLKPVLPETSKSFSNIFIIEPDTEEMIQKRGAVYGVINIIADEEFDTNLISKVTHDILYENYFHSDNISPTQSLEAAINNLKDKVSNLSNESIRQDKHPISFNIISAVLWGNVVYVVQYGSAHSFLVRGGTIKPINKLSEGAFSAASGVVHDDDVIILCSKAFGQKYPPNKMISSQLDATQLTNDEAGILIKFKIDTTFTQSEVVNFGLEELPKKKQNKILGLLKKIKLPKVTLPKFQRKIKNRPVIAIDKIVNIEKLTPTIASSGIKLRPANKFDVKQLLKPQVLILVTIIALSGALYYAFRNRVPAEKIAEQAVQKENVPTPIVEGTQAPVKEDPDEEIFYDLNIVDTAATPTSIAVFNNTVVLADKTSGKIYFSDTNTAKFEQVKDAFPGISNVLNVGGKLSFTDNEGYKVYDLANTTVTEQYEKTDFGITGYYLGFVYSIKEDTLYRYSKTGTVLDETLWGQNSDFLNARSFAVAYDIYILKSNGDIVKYSAGNKVSFEMDTEQVQLSNPTQIVADLDFENIYIVDKGNNRVVVLTKSGKFVKEIKAQKETRWADIKAIAVSPDEKTLFVVSGTRVYKTNL